MWEELGIEPTVDPKPIRRAYAAKLKGLNPDSNPGAFQRLREAYEQALQSATQRSRHVIQMGSEIAIDKPQVETQSVAALEQPPLTFEEVERTQAARELNLALNGDDPRTALRMLTTALARGVVRLGQKDYLLDVIMTKVVQNKSLSSDEYLEILREAGWSTSPKVGEAVSQVRRVAIARGEAENWYEHLCRNAEQGKIKEARLLLFGKTALFLTGTSVNALGGELAQYKRYKEWLADRFDQRFVEHAMRIYKSGDTWLYIRDGLVVGFLALFSLGLFGVAFSAPFAAVGAIFFSRLTYHVVKQVNNRWKRRAAINRS
jgi:hypothetical protein